MKGFRSARHRVILLLALAPPALAAPAAPSPPAGDVVVLPPLMVEWKNAPLRWSYLSYPGFELLTVCSDETAIEFARRNHQLSGLLRALVADRFLFHSDVPETHVLFNEQTGRAQSQEVIAAMAEAEGVKVKGDGSMQLAAPVELADFGSMVGGLKAANLQPERIVFLPNLRLDDRDSLAVFSILPNRATWLTFGYAEDRLKFLLEARAPALPPWFIAGLLGLFRQLQVGRDDVTLERFRWLDDEESRALVADPEHPRILLPMARVFAGRRPAPGVEVTENDRRWEAQCALLVRWALDDRSGARRAALEQLVERLASEAPTEALVQECLGLGFADLRDRLSDYLSVAVNRRLELPKPAPARMPRLVPRPATPLEIARLRGNWERREIGFVRAQYPALAENYLIKARTTLHRVYDGGERDPRLLAELGLTEIEGGNPADARRFLEAAVAGGVVRPRAAYELARLHYAALPPGAAPLTAAQAETVLTPLRAALVLAPPMHETYALLAAVWIRSPTEPTPADMDHLNEGVRLFPEASSYVQRIILFNVARNDPVMAQRNAALGELHATDDAARERFAKWRTDLAAPKP